VTASDLDISALCKNPVSLAEVPLAMSRNDDTPSNATDHFSFADTPRLTCALRDGNEEAFRYLHTEWNRRLSRYCFVLAQCDATLAREVVQNTYLRIFRYAREFPNEGIFWNWVVCAARSAAADLRRSGGRYRKAVARFAEWLAFRQRANLRATR
jgi:DNA-directed RNA polymerase specialized sigma24 family protein